MTLISEIECQLLKNIQIPGHKARITYSFDVIKCKLHGDDSGARLG